MAIAIRRRRDSTANWTANNPILEDGQLGFELTASGEYDKFKIGDGKTRWNDLKYSFDYQAIKAQADIIIGNIGTSTTKAAEAMSSAQNAAASAQSAATSANVAGQAAAEAAEEAATEATELAVADIQEQFNAVIKNVTVDSEVILARGAEATLANRLSKSEEQINTLDAKVSSQLVLLPESNGIDDTEAINTILSNNVGRYIKGIQGSTYITYDSLIIKSYTTLDMTGCHILQHRKTGSPPIIKNEKAIFVYPTPVGEYTTGEGEHDTDIKIIGGFWESDDNTGGLHRLFFHQIDNLKIENLKIKTVHGKYAILVADVKGLEIKNIEYDTCSDGIHITGPASDVLISNQTGATGDDFISIGCSDYTTYDYSRGNIERVTIYDISPNVTTSNPNAIKLFINDDALITTSPGNITDVTIRNVKGTVGTNGIMLLSGAGAGGKFNGITIDNLSVYQNSAGYSQVRMFLGTSTVEKIVMKNIFDHEDNKERRGFLISCEDGTIGNFVLENCYFVKSISVKSPHMVKFLRTNVDNITISGVYGSTIYTGTSIVSIESTSVVSNIFLDKVKWSGGRVIHTQDTASLSQLFASGSSSGSVVMNVAAPTNTNAIMNWSCSDGISSVISVTNATAQLSIEGNIRPSDNSNIYIKTGTQIISPKSFGICMDVTKAAKIAYNMCFNSNPSASCGKGYVICDGTKWKNMLTGAEYIPA